MTRYLLRQTLLSLVKLFLFATIMFFLIQIIIPGDFVDQFSLFASPQERAELRHQLGLDVPIWTRYVRWLGQLVRLDLGYSFRGAPLVEVLKNAIPPTLLVFLIGTVLAFLIGLWLGKVTAWRGSNFLSRVTTLGGIILFTSFPPFLVWLLATILSDSRGYVVMGQLGGLNGRGYVGLDSGIWSGAEVSPTTITTRMIVTILGSGLFFVLLNGLLRRLFRRSIPTIVILLLVAVSSIGLWFALDIAPFAFNLLEISWLAILAYTLLSFGETMLIMQGSMTDVLKEEYINTAHAKGVTAHDVREKHAARNALLPVLSRFVISLPYMITGVVIIESAVGWPGMGTTMWNALYWQDMPVVMAMLLVVGLLALVARLFLDVIIAYFDPRIRYESAT